MKITVFTGINSKLIENEAREYGKRSGFQFIAWPEYDRENQVPRNDLEQVEFIKQLVKADKNTVICTHSDVTVLAIRVEVYQDRVVYTDTEFYHFQFMEDTSDDGMLLKLDANARFPVYPSNFASDVSSRLLRDLLALKTQEVLVPLTTEVIAESVNKIGSNNPLVLIKDVRYKTGAGLKETQDAVVNYLKEHT